MAGTVAVDFDGVLNQYDGWKGSEDLGEPRPGAKEFLEALSARYRVVILTTRESDRVDAWLREHDMPDVYVTNVKLPAFVYLDDRALTFTGEFEGLLERIVAFRAHWEAALPILGEQP